MAGRINKGFEADEFLELSSTQQKSDAPNASHKYDFPHAKKRSVTSRSSISTVTSADDDADADKDAEANNSASKPGQDEEEQDRELWDSPIEFVLSCIAMSVGLGNFWRFPTTAYENGGGAFLIPYLIVLIFIGRPLYFLEMSIGQFASKSAVKVWNMVPIAKGIGYAQAIATFSVVSYYCSIIAIAMFYFAMSFSSVLPWSWCDPDWADLETCIEVLPPSAGDVANATDAAARYARIKFGRSISDNATTNTSIVYEISSLQYFRDFLLHETNDLTYGPGVPDWRLSLCLLASWIIIAFSLIKGVKSSGKVSYVTALFPYVGLLTLLIQGCLLPGAAEGIQYFITPKWEKIFEAEVWYAAVTQSFFSLSVGFGPIVIFSSHNPFRQNIYRDATIISLMDTFTSLFAGFTIFSILGYLNYVTKTENFDDVVSGGTTLVFVAYPSAIAAFENVPQVFSVLFFLVLMTLGFGSATALTGTITNIFQDKFVNVNKHFFTVGVCTVCFLFGLVFVTPGGQWVLNIVDFFGGGFIIYILATLETIAVFWIYGYGNFSRDVRYMLGVKLGFYWKFCYVFFIPVALSGIFIYFLASFDLPLYADEKLYPTIAYVFGWLLLASALIMLPLAYIATYRQTPGVTWKERILTTLKPNPKHRPRLETDLKGWQLFCNKDGSERIDKWKAFSKEALNDPEQLKEFYDIYDSAAKQCSSWEVFNPVQEEGLLAKIKNKFGGSSKLVP